MKRRGGIKSNAAPVVIRHVKAMIQERMEAEDVEAAL